MYKQTKICDVGLGYVGLPLARLFSTKYETVGYDMNVARVDELMSGIYKTCGKVISRGYGSYLVDGRL